VLYLLSNLYWIHSLDQRHLGNLIFNIIQTLTGSFRGHYYFCLHFASNPSSISSCKYCRKSSYCTCCSTTRELLVTSSATISESSYSSRLIDSYLQLSFSILIASKVQVTERLMDKLELAFLNILYILNQPSASRDSRAHISSAMRWRCGSILFRWCLWQHSGWYGHPLAVLFDVFCPVPELPPSDSNVAPSNGHGMQP
jgi:hypothetical protein